MGRELQKRKNRSSRAKVRMKPRNHNKQVRGAVLGNALLLGAAADKWDKTLSLAQNYAKLGLLRRLQPSNGSKGQHSPAAASSGLGSQQTTAATNTTTATDANAIANKSVFAMYGREADDARFYAAQQQQRRGLQGEQMAASAANANTSTSTSTATGTVTGGMVSSAVEEVRVRRDPKTGAILSIISPPPPPPPSSTDNNHNMATAAEKKKKKQQQRTTRRGELTGPLATLSPGASDASSSDERDDSDIDADDARVRRRAHQQLHGLRYGDGERHILEQGIVAAAPKKRTQSARERVWIEALLAQHGPDDFEAMARNRTLNVRQQSAGDIKRRVKAYLATAATAATATPAE